MRDVIMETFSRIPDSTGKPSFTYNHNCYNHNLSKIGFNLQRKKVDV